MPSICFDHFITYTSAADIDEYLKEYAAAGFVPAEHTVRHEPGLRNGFVFIGPEYIEFCWVEDEGLFAEAEEADRQARASLCPFAIGWVADDVQEIHDDWTARGYAVPEVTSKAARDDPPDAPPIWSFQEIPGEFLPGVESFVLTYHKRSKDSVRKVQVAPNTTYAIAKVMFVSPKPEQQATRWRDFLAPELLITEDGGRFEVFIGPHRVGWIAPEVYHAAYGRPWDPSPHPYGELAVLHLLACDLVIARTMLEAGGRRVREIPGEGQEILLVEPDERDGFVFAVQQQPIEHWLQERMARTGEKLEIENPNR